MNITLALKFAIFFLCLSNIITILAYYQMKDKYNELKEKYDRLLGMPKEPPKKPPHNAT